MKKILICAAVIMILLSFCACNGGVSVSPSNSSSANTAEQSGADVQKITSPGIEIPDTQLSATNGNSTQPSGTDVPNTEGIKPSALDYAFGYWPEGFAGEDRDFHIRTGYYGLSLNTDSGKINRMGAFAQPKGETEAAADDGADIKALPSIDMDYSIIIDNKEHKYNGISHLYNSQGKNISVRMAESGKFMQHFDLMKLTFKDKADMPGHLEVSCLGNYFVMSFGIYPQTSGAKAVLTYSMTLDGQFDQISRSGDGKAVTIKNSSGQGYTFVSMDGSVLAAEGSMLKITSPQMTLKANKYNSSSVAVIPSSRADISDAETVTDLYGDVSVSVINLDGNKSVPVINDDQTGVFRVMMQNTPIVGEDLEQVGFRDDYINLRIKVKNASDKAMRVPLQFYREGTRSYTVAPVIRDSQTGEPMGLPVQVSVNFHAHEGYGAEDLRSYMTGLWMRYYTVIEIQPGRSVTFDFIGTLARWGGLPAVTHQQISLIGWGGYQQWEHEMTTSGGSLCYDMVRAWNGANFADAYPNYVTMKDDSGKDILSLNYWNNVGGGDFIFYTKGAGRSNMAQVKTQYRLNGPNLNETIYTGYTNDFKVKFEISAYFARDNAAAQFIHSFKYTFLEDVEFDRMVFYQCGADSYTYSWWTKMAAGNADGLVSFKIDDTSYDGVFDVPALGYKAYVGDSGAMQRLDLGANLWTAMLGAERGKGYSNRIMSVHSFDATINGAHYDRPTLSILSTNINGQSCISEITPPKEAGNVIKAGSIVEGTIGYILLPGAKSEYGGDSKVMLGLPDEIYDTWEMAYLFATQSGTTVSASKGEVVRNFPAAVKSDGTENGIAAQFTVNKGIGYFPVSIKNLPDYKGWRLQKNVNGRWEDIDQSVKGNDYWQCCYDVQSQTYELIFNLEHNGNNDSGEYRLIRI